MKKHIIFLLALALACSCVKYEMPESDLSLEGMWAPVEEGSCTDRYLEFRLGKCYTYITAKILYVGDGKIWGCHINDFVIMAAEDYYIKDNKLVVGGANVGEISFDGGNMVRIGGCPFQHVEELTSDVYKLRSVTNLTLLHAGVPVHNPDKDDLVLEMIRGDVDELNVVITPNDAVDKSLFWYSDSPEVVSVGQDGTLTARGNGEAWVNVYCKNNLEVKDSCKVVVSTDLSRDGLANCYVTSRPGHYIFPAFIADGEVSEAITDISGAKLLWTSFNNATAPKEGELVRNVSFEEKDCLISFDVDFGTSKGGNAVIAAVDDSDNVLWSWHIWAARGFDPAVRAETYMLHDRLAGPVCMDRNLGALGADAENGNESFGLFYQWGRKDPFLCAAGKTDYAPVASFCNPGWNSVPSDSATGTVAYATAHPTSFIASSGKNWLVDGTEPSSLWNPDTKSKYDPCPAGWMLPGIELWKTPGESQTEMTPTVDEDAHGVLFRNLVWNSRAWYPAAGFIDGNIDRISGIGTESRVFSASLENSLPLAFAFTMSDSFSVKYSSRSEFDYGFQIRCVLKEEW